MMHSQNAHTMSSVQKTEKTRDEVLASVGRGFGMPLGPTERASVFREKNVTAADSSDPPAISSHARKCLLITHKKIEYSPG